LLVTDRRYRRRGAASRLVAEGLGWADAEGAWAGVEASPMGESVYARFGFEKVSDRTVKVEGEREELSFAVMLRRPRPG
jgi:GNAT superfamily N-acetyltransferase